MHHGFMPRAPHWYIGAVPDDSPYSTPVAPPVSYAGEEPGQLRAHWCRSVWRTQSFPALPDLVSRRAQRWEAIKAERERRKSAGVQVGEVWVQSDADSRTQQLMLYTKAITGKAVPPVPWKVLGGTFVVMSAAFAEQIGEAMQAHDIALFGHAEALRALVEAAQDPASIDITAGWPLAYGESAPAQPPADDPAQQE